MNSGPYAPELPACVQPPPLEHRSIDQIERKQAFQRRHPGVSITFPREDGVLEFCASWVNVSLDPDVDGTPEKRCHEELRYLLDELEALFDRGGRVAARPCAAA